MFFSDPVSSVNIGTPDKNNWPRTLELLIFKVPFTNIFITFISTWRVKSPNIRLKAGYTRAWSIFRRNGGTVLKQILRILQFVKLDSNIGADFSVVLY